MRIDIEGLVAFECERNWELDPSADERGVIGYVVRLGGVPVFYWLHETNGQYYDGDDLDRWRLDAIQAFAERLERLLDAEE